MSCPICGANCRCRKAGEGGLCCPCHRHKARARRMGLSVEQLSDLHKQPARSETPEPLRDLVEAIEHELELKFKSEGQS